MSMAWSKCLERLQQELPAQQYNTWIRPLQVDIQTNQILLFAPNRFVLDWVNERYLSRITEILIDGNPNLPISVSLEIGSHTNVKPPIALKQASSQPVLEGKSAEHHVEKIQSESSIHTETSANTATDNSRLQVSRSSKTAPSKVEPRWQPSQPAVVSRSTSPTSSLGGGKREINIGGTTQHKSNLNRAFVFDNFVEGKSNQLARAAAVQVAENPGGAYNPLFLYGGVGLGKTHLMHAVGNFLFTKNKNAKILYLHSERFVADMVKALQINAITEFKRFYRSVDALLIDDIQFFAGKERSQEEFFHTFNALLEGGQQMILTSDRYPKEIAGVEERLKSRFGWGLTVAVDPPELETRVAILMRKAEASKVVLPPETAFFIAQKIRSNVRELEGALKRVVANSHFTGKPITLDFVKESLKDLLALQDRQISIENIQKVVAEYFKIKIADLRSKRRSRSVARPRQIAMSLAKELTQHSLPEIGDAFGGRDHTTVIHACRKIAELRISSSDVEEDVKNLSRLLTS